MNLNKWFAQIAETVAHAAGHAVAFHNLLHRRHRVGGFGSSVWILGHLATRDQYRDHNCHVLDGLLNPELSKSG